MGVKIAVDSKTFYAAFRKKVIDPLKKKLARKPALVPFIKLLETELPQQLYGQITRVNGMQLPGALKFVTVVDRLGKWLHSIGAGEYVPIVIPMLETAVRLVYAKTLESFFDKYQLEDAFETWLGFEVDTGDKTPAKSVPPATVPATPS